MRLRRLTEEEIRAVILAPLDITASVKDRLNYWGIAGGKSLRVTVAKEEEVITVVTVVVKER